ncbi:MAG: hypothetical protein CVV32_04685 [Methanomicrobiales archaeon HGW-Methanomicrobiales-3]|jgi:hypothetical protein|nr:MAG: hypothetical protein CVV32_04685 [Methanomicrobiales archaeon HGW-Methanomicrobiales-3]
MSKPVFGRGGLQAGTLPEKWDWLGYYTIDFFGAEGPDPRFLEGIVGFFLATGNPFFPFGNGARTGRKATPLAGKE